MRNVLHVLIDPFSVHAFTKPGYQLGGERGEAASLVPGNFLARKASEIACYPLWYGMFILLRNSLPPILLMAYVRQKPRGRMPLLAMRPPFGPLWPRIGGVWGLGGWCLRIQHVSEVYGFWYKL